MLHEPQAQKAVADFLEGYRRGAIPSVTEYGVEHPEMKQLIESLLPGLLLMENLGKKFRGERSPVRDSTAGLGPAGREAARGLPPSAGAPNRLGDFCIVRELGRGGMGVVYEAVQESLQRRVALKVLPFHSLMDQRLLERFKLEAHAAARLQHPNIVPVYGTGVENGVHYYAMQLVTGQSLEAVGREVKRIRSSGQAAGRREASGEPGDRILKASTMALDLLSGFSSSTRFVASPPSVSPLPAELHPTASSRLPRGYQVALARIGMQVADALEYAHQSSVLHRDIKPSNLILDCDGKPWVTDFGLAKDLGSDSLTQTGEVLGTLRYIPPEGFQGRWDARGDVYSLGLTLYELLALRPAFAQTDRGALIKAVLEQDPPALRKLEPAIDRDLETIVAKAVRKEPSERYSSAGELARDLERFTRGLPIHAHPPSAWYRASRLVRRHRVSSVVLALGLLAAAAFGVRSWLRSQRAEGPNGAVLADFDGDGAVDVATTNNGSGNVSVLLGPRAGKPRIRTYPVGECPNAASAADFDGDGRTDIAVTIPSPPEIRILLARGGKMEASQVVPVKAVPYSSCPLDMDGDGKADIAVAGGEKHVWTFKNDGGRGFQAHVELEVAPFPNHILAADHDGDRRDDLIVTHPATRTISLLRNLGQGAFGPVESMDADAQVIHGAAQDLDGYGRTDLAFAAFDGKVSILWNGGGARSPKPQVIPVGGQVQAIVSADLDGDGNVDLAAAGGINLVAVLRNRGSRRFDEPSRILSGRNPSSINCHDWDGDGALDLIIANFASSDLSVLRNQGGLSFSESAVLSISPW